MDAAPHPCALQAVLQSGPPTQTNGEVRLGGSAGRQRWRFITLSAMRRLSESHLPGASGGAGGAEGAGAAAVRAREDRDGMRE